MNKQKRPDYTNFTKDDLIKIIYSRDDELESLNRGIKILQIEYKKLELFNDTALNVLDDVQKKIRDFSLDITLT